MTDEAISVDALSAAREALITKIVGNMPERHRAFLLSFERGSPDWSLLGVKAAANLPAVKWRQNNLDTLAPANSPPTLILTKKPPLLDLDGGVVKNRNIPAAKQRSARCGQGSHWLFPRIAPYALCGSDSLPCVFP